MKAKFYKENRDKIIEILDNLANLDVSNINERLELEFEIEELDLDDNTITITAIDGNVLEGNPVLLVKRCYILDLNVDDLYDSIYEEYMECCAESE